MWVWLWLSCRAVEPPAAPLPSPPGAAVFAGGPLYDAHRVASTVSRVRASGFDTVLLWSLHIAATGDLLLNGDVLVREGLYVGRADWPSQVARLKWEPTEVDRIEFSIGAWEVPDFENLQARIEAEGTGSDSVLYRNFQALREALPVVDAINYDDESNYDHASMVAASVMLADLGYRITFVPYRLQPFWQGVYEAVEAERPGAVDRIYVQGYAGGRRNTPSEWAMFPTATLHFGKRTRRFSRRLCEGSGSSPGAVRHALAGWRDELDGGFLWLLDDMLACEHRYPISAYAEAIREGLGAPGAAAR